MSKFQSLIESTSLIESLPIELWSIILKCTPYTNAKDFIFLVTLYKLFNHHELEELKKKYIYDYIIECTPLNKHIYSIYNNLTTIDTKMKYITNYSHIFQQMCKIKHEYIINSLKLKNYLLNKIDNKKDKIKFQNITDRIYRDSEEFNNRNNRNKINNNFRGGANNERIAGENRVLEEQNRILNRRMDEIVRNKEQEKPKKKRGLIRRSISSMASLIPGLGNLTSDSVEQEDIKQREDNLNKQMKQELNDVGKTQTVKQKMNETAAQTISDGLQSTVLGSSNAQPKKKKKSFLSALGSRVGRMYKRRLTSIVNTVSGKKKEVGETEEEVQKIALKKQCDAQFISGFNQLMDTCTKQEALEIYNKTLFRIQKSKDSFAPKTRKLILEAKQIPFNTKEELVFDTKIKGIDLEESEDNDIKQLQDDINEDLGIKNVKKSKKIVKNLKVKKSSNV